MNHGTLSLNNLLGRGNVYKLIKDNIAVDDLSMDLTEDLD